MTTKEQVLGFYARHPSLRTVPFVGTFLEDLGKTKTDLAARVRVEYWLAPVLAIKNLKKAHRVAPRKYSGGLLLNILGWQVIRILVADLRWRARRAFTPKPEVTIERIVDRLDAEGVIVLEDIFSADEIKELQDDFVEKSPQFMAHFPEFKEGYIIPTNASPLWAKPVGSTVAEQLIVNNAQLTAIVEGVSGHRMRLRPEVTYLEYKAKLDQLGKAQVDGQDILHADVCYPSFKIFIYVHDTDATNGAFRFCPRSHRVNLRRLYVEYKMAIRYYWLTRTGYHKPIELTDSEKRLLELTDAEVPQCGKAGSVIIFNTMGFHRRGDFTDAQKPYRHVILSNYRHLDTIANALGWAIT